jgi:hypothetical protein
MKAFKTGRADVIIATGLEVNIKLFKRKRKRKASTTGRGDVKICAGV